MEASRIKVVYAATERGGRHYTSRVGVAFVDAAGALHVQLDALPISGALCIVDYAPPREELAAVGQGERGREPSASSA